MSGMPRRSGILEDNTLPLVTIITVCRNSDDYIETAIESVLNQTYPKIEYIIVDGCSTDGTLDIIKRYDGHLAQWISEPDHGIYDAMNKGIRMATGQVIGLLNADDWYETGTVAAVVDLFRSDDGIDAVCGDLMIHDLDGREKILEHGSECFVRHPTLFVRKAVYDRLGLFDTSFPVAADTDFIMRLATSCRIRYLNRVLTHMRDGGASTRSYFWIGLEVFRVRRKHGVNWAACLFYLVRESFIPYLRIAVEKLGLGKAVALYRKFRYRRKKKFF